MLRFACFPPTERQRRRKRKRNEEITYSQKFDCCRIVGVKRISLSMLETFTHGVAEKTSMAVNLTLRLDLEILHSPVVLYQRYVIKMK